MYQQAIGKILQGRGMRSSFRCVYVVRDKDKNLYVGKTRNSITTRINQHCATYTSPKEASLLGKIINRNIPESYDWVVDVYTLEECLVAIQEKYPHVEKVDHDEAELGMILIIKPTLNIMNNNRRTPLPEKFRSGKQLKLF